MDTKFQRLRPKNTINITEAEISTLCATEGNKGVNHSSNNERVWRGVQTTSNDNADKREDEDFRYV